MSANKPPTLELALTLRPQWIGASGLWRRKPDGAEVAVDAQEIGLSDDLADRLEDWTDTFDSIYDEIEPECSRFHARETYAAFVIEGEALASLIRRETGADVRLDIPRQVRPEDA